MTITHGVRASDGLAALDGPPTLLAEALDRVWTHWAATLGATPFTGPPLLPVADLAALDVYRNFPHLALVAGALDVTAGSARELERQAEAGAFDPVSLRSAVLALPSSACYAVYLDHRGRAVPEGGELVTVLGQCYREEDHFDGLRRLRAFRMREVVALGTPEQVDAHLARSSEFVERLADALRLPLERHGATDPFFDPAGERTTFQKIVPVKHEYTYRGTAVASVNTHFTFFGERCEVPLADGGPAATGCVGFGVERWLHALADHFGGSWEAATRAVEGIQVTAG
ncbi:hypothetical protein ACFV4N_34645 [Actinosynnema sp. NPDC059797]